ncbi:MAG: LD-carboxypeptidase, partial [bacterium]|nr:LD-carboxypeptidase [bacterium]
MPKKQGLFPLSRGDTIGLIAPASPFEKKVFFQGIRNLKRLGFSVDYRKDIFNRSGYLAGSDERR